MMSLMKTSLASITIWIQICRILTKVSSTSLTWLMRINPTFTRRSTELKSNSWKPSVQNRRRSSFKRRSPPFRLLNRLLTMSNSLNGWGPCKRLARRIHLATPASSTRRPPCKTYSTSLATRTSIWAIGRGFPQEQVIIVPAPSLIKAISRLAQWRVGTWNSADWDRVHFTSQSCSLRDIPSLGSLMEIR